MNDADVQPDVIVRTALQRLPVPPHGDEFWAQLERALDAEAPASAPVEPVRRVLVGAPGAEPEPAAQLLDLDRDPSLAVIPAALRRTSNVVLLAVAAAAVVVVVLAGNSLLEERRGTQPGGGGDEEALATLDNLVNDAQTDGATVSTMSAVGEDASSEAVLAWVEDLGTGDGQAAWAAMGPASQASFDSQADFESEMTELADGYGAWSAATPDDVLVTPVVATEDGTIAVVTLVGTVEKGGTMRPWADAFPVRVIDGEAILEPFASAGDLEVVIPEAGVAEGELLPMEPGEELVFVVPSGADAPVLRLDGGDTVICGQADGTELSDLEDTAGQRCAFLPDGGLALGEHMVTVAFMGDDGESITAESLRFEAA